MTSSPLRGVCGVVLFFVVMVSVGFGGAPDSIVGLLYTQTEKYVGAGDGQGYVRRDILFGDNGSYISLMTTSRTLGSSPTNYSFPQNGKWTYRKTGERTAELVLDDLTRELTFQTDFSGYIFLPTQISTTSFVLAVYDSTPPLINVSNRSFVRAGGTAFTGFVITNPSRGRILLRAVGPSLGQFGVTDAIARPVITVVDAAKNNVVARNSGWTDDVNIVQANTRVGAFALMNGSTDSALLLTLEPGAYIAQVSSTNAGESGEVLTEVYVLP